MVDPGLVALVGSPADVATFVAVLYLYRERVVNDLDTMSAALVLIAREHPRVSSDRVADELDVQEDDLDDVRPVMAHGPASDGSQHD